MNTLCLLGQIPFTIFRFHFVNFIDAAEHFDFIVRFVDSLLPH